MGFLDFLFGFGRKKSEASKERHKEALAIESICHKIDEFLASPKYISRKAYKPFTEMSEGTIRFFLTLIDSELLSSFCANNSLDEKKVRNTIANYQSIDSLIEAHNDQYVGRLMVEEKQYLDGILKDVDSKIILDSDQRKVVLTDEDYSLVIAGAGAGKTTTVAAKVKYLVDKRGIDPSEILVVSFTNKAVNELKEKINEQLGIAAPITTFHSAGYTIIKKQTEEKLNIVDSSKLYFILQDYFKRSILTNESLVNNLIMFFASYFEAPYDGADLQTFFNHIAKANFATMRSDLDEFKEDIIDIRSGRKITIQNEYLRSRQEVEIANFLYLNGIDYRYEPTYKYDIHFAKKPYTPDFIIRQGDLVAYIEHFGITEDGKNNRYNERQLDAYKSAINDKISLHRRHGTSLIYTFSSYKDGRHFIDHLKEKLEDLGFALTPRSNKEIMEKLVSTEENRYIKKLLALICRFISNFKTNGYDHSEFNRMYHSTRNVRTRLFLDICNDCYLEYERYLKENSAIDFQDMINESARLLREAEEMKTKLKFKYIIVDEYQDISKQRFDLVSALSNLCEAKIIAVGDDWQSIYAFSGSDIELFVNFSEKMGYAKLLKIVNTYRNAQEVIDIAGGFIQKNERQIKKSLTSPKTIEDPVIIYTYDGSRKWNGADTKSGANYESARAVEIALEQIIEYNEREGRPKDSSILLLGRYGFDGDKLEKSGLFEYNRERGSKVISVKYPFLNIEFMTAHSSKGLGYDNVIIINCKNESYGFPSKIEDDPVLSFVIKGDRSIDYAEERRLFYVAMTRTKNRVYFIAPEKNPSEFLVEIKREFKNVKLVGSWDEDNPGISVAKKTCPICGYPLQFKYKSGYGLRLHICTNDPEVCGFMTNEYAAGKLSIMKCDSCRDGYLVVKPSKDGSSYFLGCTNYKKDGTGCGRIVWKSEYYGMFGLTADDEPKDVPRITIEIVGDGKTGASVGNRCEIVVKNSGESREPSNGNPCVAPVENTQSEARSKDETSSSGDVGFEEIRRLIPTRVPPKPAENTKTHTAQPTCSQDIRIDTPESMHSSCTTSEPREKTECSPRKEAVTPSIPEAKGFSVHYGAFDLNFILHQILECVFEVSKKKFYGIGAIVDVLRGSENKRMVSGKLYLIPQYNSLCHVPKDIIELATCWLIERHYLIKTKGLYPVLHLTNEGYHYGEHITEKELKDLYEKIDSFLRLK